MRGFLLALSVCVLVAAPSIGGSASPSSDGRSKDESVEASVGYRVAKVDRVAARVRFDRVGIRPDVEGAPVILDLDFRVIDGRVETASGTDVRPSDLRRGQDVRVWFDARGDVERIEVDFL